VHQANLAANAVPGSVPYRLYMDQMKEILISRGMSAAQASQLAVGQAYQQMIRQASMLGYKNAFFILSVVIFCLSPLPFIMRLPSKADKPDPEALGGH
jgi:DHA2 family multidrug resistance protein